MGERGVGLYTALRYSTTYGGVTVNTHSVLIPHDLSTLHTTEFRSHRNALWDSAFVTHTRRIKDSMLQNFFSTNRFSFQARDWHKRSPFSTMRVQLCGIIMDVILIYHWSGPRKSKMTSVHRRSLGVVCGEFDLNAIPWQPAGPQMCPYSFSVLRGNPSQGELICGPKCF